MSLYSWSLLKFLDKQKIFRKFPLPKDLLISETVQIYYIKEMRKEKWQKELEAKMVKFTK